MKWIGGLKEQIIDFNKGLYTFIIRAGGDAAFKNSKDMVADAEKFQGLVTSVIIQLEGRGLLETNVSALARSCYGQAVVVANKGPSAREMEKFVAYTELLATHSSFLFKEEWERVKIEASGPIYATYLRFKQKKRKRAYIKFYQSDGYFHTEFARPKSIFIPPNSSAAAKDARPASTSKDN